MPLPPRMFPGDEELGKRDDDHKPGGKKNPLGLVWQGRRMAVAHGPPRRTLKRVGLGILALIAVYYFFKNMPTDLENPSRRPHYVPNTGSSTPSRTPTSQKAKGGAAEIPHDFSGPIKFYELAESLHSVENTRGMDPINPNVVCKASLRCSHKLTLLVVRSSQSQKRSDSSTYSL